ncbi:MAG TPA: response regulator transcription factor [Nakamurella sp.]|nr:response regulator transcription factor [Nakamurella sp.]
MNETPPARGLVLVIEDEAVIADGVRRYLMAAGFGVTIATTGRDGMAAITRERPVAIVMDIGLPDADGVELCRQLRSSGDWTPVLFATARDEDVDRILGLEMGGDDYLVKPFNPRELVARIKAVLRRSSGPASTPVLRAGRVRLDPARRRVWVDNGPTDDPAADDPAADDPAADHRAADQPAPGHPAGGGSTVSGAGEAEQAREIDLTATEFDLLEFLVRHPGRVFERAGLLSSVWGYSTGAGRRTVDVHVAALRAKLGEASPIRTVRGVGYSADPR